MVRDTCVIYSLFCFNTLRSGENMAFDVIIFATGFTVVIASFPNLITFAINHVLVLTGRISVPCPRCQREHYSRLLCWKKWTHRLHGHDYSWFPQLLPNMRYDYV